MFLLDTNVVSELRRARAGRADPNVVAWARTDGSSVSYLSAVTVMELQIGILRIERRDLPQAERLQDWLETILLPSFEDRVLSIGMDIAMRCARLHVPDPRPERDALIAATALVHGLTIVTRNVADFAPMGVKIFNPWESR